MEFAQKISAEIFKQKYMLHGEETPEQVLVGVAQEISSVEKSSKLKSLWSEQFYHAMLDRKFTPAGRILANARPNSKLKNYGNCFVIPIYDSLEAIYKAIQEDAIISGAGGGVGLNCSTLRPRDASISKGGESSGPLSFLEVFNASAKTIRNGGGRRCLPLYYQVVMGDGTLKPITDIKEGDFVLFEEKQYKVNAVYHNGVQELIRIKTSAGKWHVSTLNHRWLVWDNYAEVPVWVEAKNLMPELFPKYSFMSLKTEQDPDDTGYALDPIVKLEFLPAEDTIDIEVAEVHAFYAYNPESGLASISHNSAHIAIMDVNHPDIEEFITYKQGDLNKRLQQFNISVGITKEFLEALEKDSDWNLTFEGKVYKTIKARDLFNKIAEHAFIHNEPGLVFYPSIDERNTGWYIPEIGDIRATNPCAEQPLPPYGICNLGAINLSRLVINPFGQVVKFDWDEFAATIHLAVRFLDDVIDSMEYPLPAIKALQQKTRRVGLGITGLADAFFMMGLPYGSAASVQFAEQLGDKLHYESMKASIELAKEKGAFPAFNFKKYCETPFVKQFLEKHPDLVKPLKKYGIRNVALNTIAPTGTTSIALGENCSSGIEPVFAPVYIRKVRTGVGDETREEEVMDYAYYVARERMQMSHEDIMKRIDTIETISPQAAMDIQAALQKSIDASISKTYNLPGNYTLEEYKDLILAATKKGLVGFTSFNPNGSLAPILSTTDKKKEPEKDSRDHIKHIAETNAPKRPKDLKATIDAVTVSGQKYIVIVGYLGDKAYECFFSEYNPSYEYAVGKEGIIRKIKKGHYQLIIPNGEDTIVIDNISATFNHDYEALSRLLSISLRHGVPVDFIVDQLSKTGPFGSWGKSVARVLKKAIKDGQEVRTSSAVCPQCGSNSLVYKEGCVTCSSCGYSKC